MEPVADLPEMKASRSIRPCCANIETQRYPTLSSRDEKRLTPMRIAQGTTVDNICSRRASSEDVLPFIPNPNRKPMHDLAHCLNELCPRSGKPVVANSLVIYRDYVLGFCNPGCRDDFAANPEACPEDRAVFDKLVAKASQYN
jgi:hypothetical protein